jgi:hypothetical protein
MIPKQIEASPKAARTFRPKADVVLNVGDLAAEGPDGSLVSAAHWTSRAAFAAAFAGISQTHFDPKFRRSGFPPLAVAVGGGLWAMECVGPCPDKAPLGPVVNTDGSLHPQNLEVVAEEEAVAYATDKPNVVRVK